MVDNGASASITPYLTDFISPPQPINSKVKGIGGHAQATYKGTIQWKIQDDQGRTHQFTLPNSYFVATAPSRILCPQHLAQTAKDNYPLPLGTGAITGGEYIQLFWDQRKYVKTIKLDPRRNVGMTHTAPGIHKFNGFMAQQAIQTPCPCCFDTHIIPDDEEESIQPPDPVQPQTEEVQPQFPLQQLRPSATTQEQLDKNTPSTPQVDFTPLQQTVTPNLIEDEEEPTKLNPSDELLRWHYKLGHAPFKLLQNMAKKGDLPKRLATVIPPFCAACKYGKQTKRPWRTKGPQGHIRTATQPGQVVSVDQLESTTPGFVAQLKGLLTTQRYNYATIFVDQYSKLSFVFLQKRIMSAETVLAKQSFEQFAHDHGVKILHYHADNGRFADNGFIQACKDNNQGLTYCGVNAHFQNGVAEKRIRDLQEQARTMLLFAVHKWPKMLSMALWPYALRTANEVRNSTPMENQTKTPMELFAQVAIAPKLKHFHTFGCPTYILDNRLQGNKALQKWQARSRLGIYLGPSPNHSRSISLILNPRTGHTSPQYHVKHDDFFETVNPKKTTNFDAPPPEWKYLARFLQQKRPAQQKVKDSKRTSQPDTSVLQVSEGARQEPAIHPPMEQPLQSELDSPIEEQVNPRILAPPQQLPHQDEELPVASLVPPSREEETPQVTTTRSGRAIRPTARYQQSLAQREHGIVAWEILVDQDEQENIPTAKQQYELQVQLSEPIVYAASNDPDILYLHEAMKAPDRTQFLEAMEREIKGHEEGNHWVLVPKHQVPRGTKVLDAVWLMRRKRRIESQEIYKWKARLNVHGGQQVHGINYWDTYTPVVAWPVIRFFFILSILQGWKTRQLDFIMAFPQAPIQTPLYMSIPKGYKTPKDENNNPMVLKLIRNIYGQKQGPKVWGDFLHQGLIKASFEQSKVDPCLYYREGLIFLVYIDDCLLLSPLDKLIDQGIHDLRKAEPRFNMEDQGTVNDFLGIQVKHKENGEITLTQPQLISSILNDLNLNKNNVHTRATPSLSTILLHKDASGRSMSNEFNYRSVIGKLNFLEKSTRPDIAYAVHQCARFSADPKQSHADAVKRIGRYLKGTPNVGITLRPDTQQSFQCWVDADFSGNWRPEGAQHDPMTAKSRSGWIIRYAGCPITWSSKLQTLTALSTTEAEYVALSMAMREQLPLIQLLKEVVEHKIDATLLPTTIHCKAFEDNSGALEMAKVPKMRPRTKHLNNVYHHFRESVHNNEVTLIAVRSDEQLADILTKPLPDTLFQRFRDQILNYTTADQKPLGEGV